MENQEHSSGSSSGGSNWVLSLIHTVLSYYSDLISNPFKSGLAYFIAGLVPALIIGWLVFPMLLYSKQQQPINFNHALHMDPKIITGIGKTKEEKCLFCHRFRKDGSFAGIPKIKICIVCHKDPNSPLGNSHELALFLKNYVVKKKEVPWLVYSKQPDCVYFSHIAHVKMGKIACKVCHGPFGENQTLPVYEKNRISSYSIDIWGRNIAGIKKHSWDSMKMDDCANCHTKDGHEEDNACFVCHK